MSDEINVVSRTQTIMVEPSSSAVSIINAGPQGPPGPIGLTGPTGPTGPIGKAANPIFTENSRTVSNTVTDSPVVDAPIGSTSLIAAGSLLVIEITGYITNQTGTAKTQIYRVKLGNTSGGYAAATSLYASTAYSLVSASDARNWSLRILAYFSAVNAQIIASDLKISAPQPAGTWQPLDSIGAHLMREAPVAQDFSAAAKSIYFGVQHSAASSQLAMGHEGVRMYHLPAP